MKMRIVISSFAALAGAMVSGYGADAPTLRVGQPAPQLQVSKWVQGEPVKDFERGKAYVVEFWATWCGPCVASIPHVNELHQKYKDKGLVVIGQNVWENDTSKVDPFLKKMGEKMTYRVALDSTNGSSKGKMAETWMEAANQHGIPTAFVVNKESKVAWIGHPMGLKEPLLDQILEGKFDLAKAAADYEQKAKREVEEQTIWQEFTKHANAKEWEEADAALTKLEKLQPEGDKDKYGITRFQMLLGRKDYKGAYKYALQLSDAHPDNSFMQNELAWRIATAKNIEERDLDVAEKIARRAVETTKWKDPEILDTLARVLFVKGDKDKAVEYQSKVVELSDGNRKKQYQATLDSYKKGEEPKKN